MRLLDAFSWKVLREQVRMITGQGWRVRIGDLRWRSTTDSLGAGTVITMAESELECQEPRVSHVRVLLDLDKVSLGSDRE